MPPVKKLEKTEGEEKREREFSFATSIEEVARATDLRVEDVAFALVESGLAQWRLNEGGEEAEGEQGGEEAKLTGEEVLVISREFVAEMQLNLMVKPPILDEQYVLL